jgi:hypothetical protein
MSKIAKQQIKGRKTKIWALDIKATQSFEWASNLHASSVDVSVKGIIHPQIVCAPAVRERSQT